MRHPSLTYRGLLIEMTEQLRHVPADKLAEMLDAPVRISFPGGDLTIESVTVEEGYDAEPDEDPSDTQPWHLTISPWLI
ncbi:hypothetical protein AB0368_06745 [Actinoplanes sp. NPDC051475]|uniref:hypothetical protein n=1 Tax=Actinoplanes sp. NPDC051475 TaxID=3157225 RepID=UPI00344D24A6